MPYHFVRPLLPSWSVNGSAFGVLRIENVGSELDHEPDDYRR